MSRVLAACLPASDAEFGERVRRVIAQDRWDLDSPEGAGLMQAFLRQSYPMAAVVGHGGVRAGGIRRTVVLDVHRDGTPEAATRAVRWTEAVYELSGTAAYRAAARILGEGAAAELIVEHAFREICRSVVVDTSVEAGGAAVEAAALRLASEARAEEAAPSDAMPEASAAEPLLAGASLRIGGVRRSVSGVALAGMLSSQRAALELALLEDLKVSEIAERMQTRPSVVNGHLKDALLAVGSGVTPSASTTLARWREAQRSWLQLPAGHAARPGRALDVAHAWLDFQGATNAVRSGTVVLVTDPDRRFVAATGNAGRMLARPSVIGHHIDDITAEYARPLVPELWTVFREIGSMDGDYDCDRPGLAPIRIPFHGTWGRPLPDLQVGYLQAAPPPRV
ncbi:MAG TPA: hypothetical protein VMZ66_00325 [Aeromicrobium sp.]|nr:hypothetical protein [Aeromicrobium sp.]